jgi:protein SCO1/2
MSGLRKTTEGNALPGVPYRRRSSRSWNATEGVPCSRRIGAAILLGALLLAAASAQAQVDDYTPGATAGAKITNKPDAQVPLDLQLADESGQTVKLGDYFQSNRPVLLVMVYFGCPQLCSLTLNGVTDAVRQIDLQPGREFEIVTVSFDPKEGPSLAAEKKANYIKSLGNTAAAAGWHFLTSSDPAAAKTLGDAIGFGYRQDPKTGLYLHEAGIYLCTPGGRVSRVERNVTFDPIALRDSLIHASEGKISSGLFGVALACGLAHFDLQTGKYTWAALAIMRVTGITTLLLLASGIGWMVYRENRKKVAQGTP